MYHVKEHLTPKDIHERGLATTLEAFEVKDFETGIKRSLLQYLYPDREFHQTFNSYILEKRTYSYPGRTRTLDVRIPWTYAYPGLTRTLDVHVPWTYTYPGLTRTLDVHVP